MCRTNLSAQGLSNVLCLRADYIDYQNRRPDYIGEFVENLINWKKVLCSLCTSHAEQVLGTCRTYHWVYLCGSSVH